VRRRFQLELPVRREWEAIDPLRQTVTACLRVVFSDLALCDALAMVAGELLENAVKYGTIGPGVERGIGISVVGDEDGVEVEVASPLPPGGRDLARLEAELERIARAPSPQEAYLDAMRRVALRGSGSGLGLARIAHEGGCDLHASLGDDGLLRVRATTRGLRPPRPTAAPPA
jgi:anti-sigma regulatory factor (Ser/Thr protein kinase)